MRRDDESPNVDLQLQRRPKPIEIPLPGSPARWASDPSWMDWLIYAVLFAGAAAMLWAALTLLLAL